MTEMNLETHPNTNEMITRTEIESKISQLRNRLNIMQLAQQALHSQFQEVNATFIAVNRQWQESQETFTAMQTMLNSLRGLLDQSSSNAVPSNWRRM